MIVERIVPLDDDRFGILNEPARNNASKPVVVLFNVGLVHRAGPFRQQVQLARHLARLGYSVLRYDMPGIGDSSFSSKTELTIVSGVFDRLDVLLGARGYIIGGICAAADRGWNIALADPRVRGLLLIDGVARSGKSFRAGQMKLVLSRPLKSWPGMVRRRLSETGKESQEETFRDWPAEGNEPAELRQLVERDVRVLAIYTGGIAHYFLHAGQFRETFGSVVDDQRVEFEFWPDCDHLIMSSGDRQRLHKRIGDWCVSVKPL